MLRLVIKQEFTEAEREARASFYFSARIACSCPTRGPPPPAGNNGNDARAVSEEPTGAQDKTKMDTRSVAELKVGTPALEENLKEGNEDTSDCC